MLPTSIFLICVILHIFSVLPCSQGLSLTKAVPVVLGLIPVSGEERKKWFVCFVQSALWREFRTRPYRNYGMDSNSTPPPTKKYLLTTSLKEKYISKYSY
jgi:hypothetical protein